jgi:hypothetical protein
MCFWMVSRPVWVKPSVSKMPHDLRMPAEHSGFGVCNQYDEMK